VVDAGARDLAGHPGVRITERLDGLRNRLKDFAVMGTIFHHNLIEGL
jgi:fructose-bisphosphate aldolase class I